MKHADNLGAASVHDLCKLNREQRYRGVRAVASAADDATDCRELLALLGLDPADGLSPSDDGPAGPSSDNDMERRGHVRRRLIRRQS